MSMFPTTHTITFGIRGILQAQEERGEAGFSPREAGSNKGKPQPVGDQMRETLLWKQRPFVLQTHDGTSHELRATPSDDRAGPVGYFGASCIITIVVVIIIMMR
mmetsp:Transcript_22609/g.63073  ORF Transcript_22609/g.63073 Transcript_22609/m.63073 type:complete len:104 (+) Transcript_22609:666-977(+)